MANKPGLADIIREALYRATKRGIILTPFNYYKIFIEVALEFGMSEADVHRYVYGADLHVSEEEIEKMKDELLKITKNIQDVAIDMDKTVQEKSKSYKAVSEKLQVYKDEIADEIAKELEKIIYVNAELQAELSHYKKILEKQKGELERIKEFSYRDPLTGLYTRRYMQSALDRLLYNFTRYSRTFSIIMIDLDDFKKINDIYGHLAGDTVLKAIASIIQKNIRKTDIPIRYGGDEFIVLLPDTDIKGAKSTAEKILAKITSTRFERRGMSFKCTASLGVTEVKKGDTLESLLERVDNALYETKNKGKIGITVLE